MSIFHKNYEKGYNICKKFQIGSVILMSQMTNWKKTELIDFFDLVWTKKSTILEKFLEIEAIFYQNSPQNRTLETSIMQAQKFRKGSNFFVKNSRKGRYRDFIVAHPRPKISWVPPPGHYTADDGNVDFRSFE